MKVLVIIPAYNEEKTIANVIQDLKKYNYIDILVINDGSKDNTSFVARNMNVVVLDHASNQGIGASMRTGFKYARTHDYDIVIQVDADGQHDISRLGEIIAKVRDEGYDMVIGSRFISKTKYNSTPYRWLGIKYCSWLIKLINRTCIKDPTSGYRAMSKYAIDFCVEHYINDYPEVPILSQLIQSGYKVCEISVEMKKRQGGKSSITFIDSIIYFVRITFICIRNNLAIRIKKWIEK